MRLRAFAALFVSVLFGATLVSCGGGATSVSTPAPSHATSPSIVTQPTTATVTAGETATFLVVAMGTAPLSYHWQKDDAAITGATSASYTLASAAPADNGSNFRVVVSNSAGSVTSNAATLTVSTTPVAPPASATNGRDSDPIASSWRTNSRPS